MIDPTDPIRSVAYALEALERDSGLREQVIDRGRRRAGECSWQRTAQAYLQLYEDALSK